MHSAIFASIVDFCLRRKWLVILTSLAVLAGSSVYVARNFALNSDINSLLAPDLRARRRIRGWWIGLIDFLSIEAWCDDG